MDVITNLSIQKGRVRISAEGRQDFLIPLSVFRKQPISQGDVLDMDVYAQGLAPLLYRHALDRAVKYLTVRARSRKEVTTHLERYGYPDDTVEMALLKLEKTGVLNDTDFAEQWARARSEKGLGKRMIARDLYQKGICSETAETALHELDEAQQLRKARELAEKWLPRYQNEDCREAARKLMQALVRRGYDWETARTAVTCLREERS